MTDAMTAFVALFMALWAEVGGDISHVYTNEDIRFRDLYGNERTATASFECGPKPVLRIAPTASILTIYHELAHAKDCLDDGLLNGSPGAPRPAERPAWASDYCWNDPAEWYACSLVHNVVVDW